MLALGNAEPYGKGEEETLAGIASGTRVGCGAKSMLLAAGALVMLAWPVSAQNVTDDSLGLSEAVRIASSQRPEMVAAQAQIRPSEQRPAIVGALEDPMVSASIEHKPFGMSAYSIWRRRQLAADMPVVATGVP